MNKSASLPSISSNNVSSSSTGLRKHSTGSRSSSSSSRKSLSRASNSAAAVKPKEKKLEFASSEYFDDDDFDPDENDLMLSLDIDETNDKSDKKMKKINSRNSMLSPISNPGKNLHPTSVTRQRKGVVMSVALQLAMTHVKDFMVFTVYYSTTITEAIIKISPLYV